MRKYKIVIAYDGTDFHGWQIQPTHVTVVSVLQNSFYALFNKRIALLGASRTDAGVHACGQVAIFRADLPVGHNRLMDIWNKALPESIVITSIEQATEDFHPCCNVIQKTYHYHLFLERPQPFYARYGWYYDFIHQVDWDKFQACLQIYVGKHDFASFCKMEDERKSTVRRIDCIELYDVPKWCAKRVVVKGPGFLRFQIRRMIGYALDIARQKNLSVKHLQEILESKNPQQTLVKAAGKGLCLIEVNYEK